MVVLPRAIRRTETLSAEIIFGPVALVSAATLPIMMRILNEDLWRLRVYRRQMLTQKKEGLTQVAKARKRRQDVVSRVCRSWSGSEEYDVTERDE
jgi:hypothetical protein